MARMWRSDLGATMARLPRARGAGAVLVRGLGLRSARSRKDGSLEIGPRDGFGGPQPTNILSHRDGPEQGKLRLHIDVNATDREQGAELERLLKLGARPADIGQTGEEPWHVLADPEGNEFCLLKARLNPL